jgi:hypothetical protein
MYFHISGLLYGQGKWRQGEKEIRIEINNRHEADKLNALNLNGDIFLSSGYADLYVISSELEKIKNEGFKITILKDDLNAFAENFWSNRDQYHTYDDIIQVIDSLCSTFPTICKKYSYGSSVEGRQLCALKISDNVNTDEPEPEVMFDGGIHGDEIGGPENLVRFAEFLCDSYLTDPQVTSLVNSREIWLYIMVNPDGRVNMTRQNSNGIDLNRDWGYMWGGTGSSPFIYSQPETRALRECVFGNQFTIEITYHSGTEFLAYPWSYRPDSCPDQPHIRQLAGVYASESGYPDLPYEQGYTGMYAIAGSSKDANYGIMGSVSWTLEISTDKQPYGSEIQYYYDINKPSMLAMIDYAGYGLSGTVTDATNGFPVPALIFVNDFYPCYNDPVIGDYHKYLLAGIYSVTAVSNGYQPVTQNITIGETGIATLDFSLQPEYHHCGYRVISCGMADTNFADESKTFAALWEPDNVNYSLGKSGWIILDMLNEIQDGPWTEFTVYEGDNSPESYSCYVSDEMDGPWQPAGNGTGTASFDLATAGLPQARFVKIVDDGDGPVWGADAGFDLDAVSVIQQPDVIFLVMDAAIDDQQGNNNHRIDPGESYDMVITLRNLGSMALENGKAYLNIDHQYISVSNPDIAMDNIAHGDSLQLVFHMVCSSFCPHNALLMSVMNIISNNGAFTQSSPVNFSASAIIEDWETVNFNKFDWVMGGNKPWAINFTDPYQGTCSAKSGNVDDGEMSDLQVTMNVIGYDDISFYKKVSSESGSDFLRFYIDNNLKGEWSGESGWENETFQVVPGYHTFKWAFEKDYANSQGSDAGWVDYIVFPSCNLDGILKALANANPHEFCGSGQSQLGAYVLGGTGDYSFAWQPAGLLDDPGGQFPIGMIEATTTFSVEVNDGQANTTSSMEVNSWPVPETPVIIQQGDSLISQADSGNQWYDYSGPVAGATGKVFHPETENDYFDIITNESGCKSDTSNIIHFIFSEINDIQQITNDIIFPNPFKEGFFIHFNHIIPKEIIIRIYDITGREVYSSDIELIDNQNDIYINPGEPGNSLYLLSVTNPQGEYILTSRIIRK